LGEDTKPGAEVTLRVGVNLVEVNCNVLGADGSHLRGLTREDFHIFEEGIEQPIAHFDASNEGASVALVIDASPSVFRDIAEMKAAARTLASELSALDEIAVVAFDAEAYLLLPFSRDRAALEASIDSVNVARGPLSKEGSNIYAAVYLAAEEVFRGRTGRKSILLLTDGQDSGLGLSWAAESALPRSGLGADRLAFEDVVRALAAAGIEVQVVSTQPRPMAMTEAWLEAHKSSTRITDEARKEGMPHYTLYLAELVRRAGGKLYFLRELETLGEVYRQIALTLRAQYTLGYYPAQRLREPGWRRLRVELPGHRDVQVLHRVAYYAPAGQWE
jgi:Ca-activated chloride channel family protein